MTAWLRRGAAAAAIASQRSDLWPAGTLAWLAYAGWLPLLIAVAPPDVGDVADLVVSLYSSGSYPANVVALAAAGVGAFLLLSLLAAAAEAAIGRALGVDRSAAHGGGEAALAGVSVILLASVPVVLAFAWLLFTAVGSAPAVYTAPQPADTVIPRLAAALLPQLIVLGAALLVAQAIGGRLLRAALAVPSERLAAALAAGIRDVAGAPVRWAGVAAVGWVKDALLLVGSWALLRTLWSAVGDSMGPGVFARPQSLVLLVGFVAIWLILLLVGGALHAFISAWWLLEEEDRERR